MRKYADLVILVSACLVLTGSALFISGLWMRNGYYIIGEMLAAFYSTLLGVGSLYVAIGLLCGGSWALVVISAVTAFAAMMPLLLYVVDALTEGSFAPPAIGFDLGLALECSGLGLWSMAAVVAYVFFDFTQFPKFIGQGKSIGDVRRNTYLAIQNKLADWDIHLCAALTLGSSILLVFMILAFNSDARSLIIIPFGAFFLFLVVGLVLRKTWAELMLIAIVLASLVSIVLDPGQPRSTSETENFPYSPAVAFFVSWIFAAVLALRHLWRTRHARQNS